MKIDFVQKLLDVEGCPIEVLDKNKMLVECTLGEVC